MQEAFNFTRRETAIMCVLMLRGPQTPGELRGRSERMHPFEDLTDVQSTLQKLMTREEPLVKVLPRQPGTKEARYAHLLCGQKAEWDAPPPVEQRVEKPPRTTNGWRGWKRKLLPCGERCPICAKKWPVSASNSSKPSRSSEIRPLCSQFH